ncbi:MAG: DUF971 domain-containing protein [Bermanella sp.]
MTQHRIPSSIKFHNQSQQLELAWQADAYLLSAELLRVLSPSAEVRGHGKGNEVLQFGKRQVRILKLEAVGNYALKIHFDDGHDSGLYHWQYLLDLAQNQALHWQGYLDKLASAGKSRDAASIQFKALD